MTHLVKKMTQSAIGVRAMSSIERYEEAVRTLNTLQSNAAYIRAVKKHNSLVNKGFEETKKYLRRSGITLDQLDTLRIIHVAGTKGKGSTCAFTESILRHHGSLTGFYSSPHLISVRERFRINGEPISESTFTRYFWKLYKCLNSKKDYEQDMPQYFKFLTIMMFHIFLEAKIDVAILEVGIGGECDCTNVIKNPICTGITSLGLDHTSVLGDSIEEIAFQKSGIFKPNAPAFTVPQPIEAMHILEKRAAERNCSLNVVQSLENFKWRNGTPKLGISSSIQNYNVSLAIHLASSWIELTQGQRISINEVRKSQSILKKTASLLESEIKSIFFSLEKTELAISNCKWPGRTQILRGKNVDFFIDGAHTVESIESCALWFRETAKNETGMKFLIFNATGDRDPEKLLLPLKDIKFNRAFFSPNIAGVKNVVDQENYSVRTNEQKNRCRRHLDIWGDGGVIVDNVSEAFNYIEMITNPREDFRSGAKAEVLITGSLHLVGAALCVLDPNLSMKTNF